MGNEKNDGEKDKKPENPWHGCPRLRARIIGGISIAFIITGITMPLAIKPPPCPNCILIDPTPGSLISVGTVLGIVAAVLFLKRRRS